MISDVGYDSINKVNPNEARVVYASDDKFAEILGVSLVSLFENSRDMESIIVYIMDSGIANLNKQKIEMVCKIYERPNPIWIKAKNICKELSMKVTVDRGSLSQYARLFISSNLPEGFHRILYLDCDIIIQKSIKELWNLDLKGKTIGALMDTFSKHYRINIDLQPDDIMFNSGVMLIDLDKWIDHHIEEKLLKFIVKKKGNIQQGDQGALNSVLSKETYCFDPKFNVVTNFFDFTYDELLIYRKVNNYYSEKLIKEAVENPNIIHFTTSFLSRRPWIEGCQHRYIEKWRTYKELSPWKDNMPWKEDIPDWKIIGKKIFRMLPRRLALLMASFMQAYGRPLIKRFKLGIILYGRGRRTGNYDRGAT